MTHPLDRTVMPDSDPSALSDLAEVLMPESRAHLVSADGRRVEIPAALFDVLREAVLAMSQGKAVTIAPHDTVMTTQEAADYLGISRPTLVKLLDQGARGAGAGVRQASRAALPPPESPQRNGAKVCSAGG